MARQLKPQKVDYVGDSKTGQHVDIMLDRNENTFFAKVGDERVTDNTANGCKEKARKLLQTLRDFDWKPYIWVQPPEEKERGSYWGGGRNAVSKMETKLVFQFWRAEIAQRPDGNWVERQFLDENGLADDDSRDLAEQHLKDRAESNRSDRTSGDDIHNHWPQHEKTYGTIKLPYNPAIWAALMAVKDRIEQARTQLDDIVKSDQFENRLLLVAKNLKLLPEGKK